ncbi:hypothetical protein GOV13_03520 [Candidatus Pacearchaeota archaeon]|nr:hypothetical protein [Candidatus Pacearchaeota archaeon]
MNWQTWLDWKGKKHIAVIGFILAYILTIPWRDYDSIFDTSQGVTIWMHLTLIAAGLIVLLIGLKLLEVVVEKWVVGKKK